MKSQSSGRSWLRAFVFGAVCVGIAGCGTVGIGKRDRAPKAPPAAETTAEAAKPPERRRARLGVPRFGRSKGQTPAPSVAAKPAIAPVAEGKPAAPSRRADIKPTPGQVVPLAPDEAKRRLVAYLKAKGYSMQQAADDSSPDLVVTDPLLTDAKPIDHLAKCGSSRLGKPILHSSIVEAHVAPDGTGSRISVGARFTEVRQQRIGEGMSKTDCPSRGVLEAEVLGALAR